MQIEFPSDKGDAVEEEKGLFAKKNWLMPALSVFVVVGLLAWQTTSSSSRYISDFFDTERKVAINADGPSLDVATIKEIEGSVKKHPELQGRFDNLVAEHFLFLGKTEEAEKIAERSFDRLGHCNTPHHEFAKNSLVIARGDYAKALESALDLKEQMLKARENSEEGPHLFAFNLIRIAFLNQLLGNNEAEIQGWDEVLKHISPQDGVKSPLGAEVASEVMDHFQNEGLSLNDYVHARKESLGTR